MKQRFQQFIANFQLITNTNPILLTVSGGVDSMVMAHLFYSCKFPFAIAHCNFQLRGEESDADESLVQQIAQKYSVKFHHIKFDTLQYSEENHLSIQQAARELRYQWFNKLLIENNYQSIATAHHSDDETETFFINIIRGTGIKGLDGIAVKQGNIIRPLLFTSREEIESYAKRKKIEFRSDSSNDDLYYLRNKIRHTIIPLFKEIQPSFDTIIARNMRRIGEENQLLQDFLQPIKESIINISSKDIRISIDKLLVSPHPNYLLYVILESYGLKSAQIADIQDNLNSQSGKKFETKNYCIVKDRNELILKKKISNAENPSVFTIDSWQLPYTLTSPELPYTLSFKKGLITNTFTINTQINTAQFDLNKLKFPLSIRKWEKGDTITPLGMKGKKKVSDILIDLKIPLTEKEEIRLVLSGNEIIWIPGIRMNEKYKISATTTEFLEISL